MITKLNHIIFVLLMLATSVSQAQVDTFTVTKTTDFDPFLYQDNPYDTAIVGTIQWAIRKANDAVNPSLIVFNIPGNGQHTINLTYQLPFLNNEITFDATTQTGYTQWNPAIIIDGSNTISICFHLANDNCSIKGCYIQNFTSKGISVYNANDFIIENNVINRIILPPPSPLKPCVIPASGIVINNCINGIIRANIIGTDASFASGLEIRDWGIWRQGVVSCLIGGNSIDDGNIIAYCKAGINQPGGCLQYRKNRFLNNEKAFANIANRCTEYLIPAPQLFSDYTNTGYTNGYTHSGSIIDIFGINDNSYNANEFLTSALADSSGFWSADVSTQYLYLTGIETDINNCSSILSSRIEQSATSGTTCATAFFLPPSTYTCSSTQLQITDTIFWMQFTADTTSMRIAIQNPTDTLAANIQKLILYSGDCNTLLEIARRDVNSGDLLEITKTDFVIGNTYLVKAMQVQAASGWFGLVTKTFSLEMRVKIQL